MQKSVYFGIKNRGKMDFLLTTLTISLVSTFIISLLRKLGIIERLQVHGINARKDSLNDLISRMANCDFCLSWWTNVLISIIAIAFIREAYVLVIPFVATPLTRHIL